MPISDALLVTLFLMEGKATTQFSWNLFLFLLHEWVPDVIPIKRVSFEGTLYGPFYPNMNKSINFLEKAGFVSYDWNELIYKKLSDLLVNGEYFENTRSYLLTYNGLKRIEKIEKTYEIDLTDMELDAILQYMWDDLPYLIRIIMLNFPEYVKE